MSYTPTERTNITWHARNKTWRLYKQDVRDHASDFPLDMRGATLDDLASDPAGRLVRKWAERWGAYPTSGLPLAPERDVRPRNNRGQGLWLYGSPGHGKTTMAAIAGQHVSNLGWSTKFISAANLYDLHKQAMDESTFEDRPLYGAAACTEHWDGWRLLVLDDLGKEYHAASGFAQNFIDRLIRNRYCSGAPTIVTSNLSLTEIREKYSPSLYSYIHEAFWIVPVDAEGQEDRRMDDET